MEWGNVEYVVWKNLANRLAIAWSDVTAVF